MPTPTRAARLAVWGTAYLRGDVPVDQAVACAEGDDEPHLVCSGMAGPDELAELLGDLRDDGWVGLRLALPAPGDPLGLTGPPEVNRAAMGAGEAVLGVPGPPSAPPAVPAVVPDVTPFGPPGDQGYCVTWRRHDASSALPDVPSVGEADRALKAAMTAATQALRSLDAAPWSPSTSRAAVLREQRPTLRMPPGVDPRAIALTDQALAVLALLDAARHDDGGALSAHASSRRSLALAPLDRAARRALVAACSPSLAAARS